MESPPCSPSELEKCASNDTPSPSHPAVDIVWVESDKTTEMKEDERKKLVKAVSGSERRQYIISSGQELNNPLVTFGYLAKRREQTERTNAPIVFIAQGSSGLDKTSRLLQAAQQLSEKKDDSISTVLSSIVGIISLPTPHPKRELTLFLHFGQCYCKDAIEYYEEKHSDTPRPDRTYDASDESWIRPAPRLLPIPGFVKNPSTFVFVLAVLIWGALVAFHYHLNKTDRFQKYFVFVGVVLAGPFVWLSLMTGGRELYIATPLSVLITMFLWFSTIVHWIWRTFVRTTKKRLNKTIDKWAREALGTDTNGRAPKFHEIV